MTSNQSGAEKDNRLLFGKKWVLLFSKSKMAEGFFSQSGAEVKVQDGDAHERAALLEHILNRRPDAGLTDSHGDTNRAKMSRNLKVDPKSALWSKAAEVRPETGHDKD